MAYTETRTVGYGTRVGNSFKQIGTGFIMFIIGTCVLWWNEGRTVKTADMLSEAQSVTEELTNINKPTPSLNGELVHASGLATTNDSIFDPEYPVGGNVMRLKREVEYYQWEETKHEERHDNTGGSETITTTYTYDKKWVSRPIDSGGFKEAGHTNTVRVQVEENEWNAENVKFGIYNLPEFFIESISGWKASPVHQNDEQIQAQEELDRLLAQLPADGDSAATAAMDPATLDNLNKQIEQARKRVDMLQKTTPTDKPYQTSGNMVYYGDNMNSAQIGDVRITFQQVDPEAKISILAKLSDDTFTKYVAKNGKRFARLEMGKKDADEMYQSAQDENDMIKWGLRLVGMLMVIGGLKMIFEFLTILLKVLPFLASIMNFGVSAICGIVGFIWSLLVIAVAWLFYRPIAGISLLVVTAAITAFFVWRGRQRRQTNPVPQPAPAPDNAANSANNPGSVPPPVPDNNDNQPQQP